MTRVKICGITNREDARAAASYGAEALGFIAVPESPRYVPEAVFQEIAGTEALLMVSRVVVSRAADDARGYGADYHQFYEEPEGRPAGPHDIRAFRVKDAGSLPDILAYPESVGAILLDTYHADKLGGSGETFNWELAREIVQRVRRPVFLAGGLTPDNIQEALEAVRPFGVDVSSGVEASPGVKDHAKVRALIRAVREWDLRQS